MLFFLNLINICLKPWLKKDKACVQFLYKKTGVSGDNPKIILKELSLFINETSIILGHFLLRNCGSVTFCLVQFRLVHFRLVHFRLVHVRLLTFCLLTFCLDNILPKHSLPRQHFA